VVVVVLALAVDLLVWGGDRSLRWGGELPVLAVPLVSTVVFATLLLRWRHPVAVFVVQWLYAWAGLVVPGYEPFAGLLVALYAVARRCSRRVAAAALGVSVLPLTLDTYNSAHLAGDAFGANFLAAAVVWAVVLLVTWGVARVAVRAEHQAEEQRHAATNAAVQHERLRLARDLHDIVSNAVSAMTLQAAGARTLVGRDEAAVRGALTAIETTGVGALDELRQLLGVLRAVGDREDPDHEAPPVGLGRLPDVVEAAGRAGVDVRTVVEGTPVELDESVAVAAYRVVQEAVSNTVRHAGRGASCRLHLVWAADRLVVDVRDRRGVVDPSRPII
jgi:signal transduction histidine kinase